MVGNLYSRNSGSSSSTSSGGNNNYDRSRSPVRGVSRNNSAESQITDSHDSFANASLSDLGATFQELQTRPIEQQQLAPSSPIAIAVEGHTEEGSSHSDKTTVSEVRPRRGVRRIGTLGKEFSVRTLFATAKDSDNPLRLQAQKELERRVKVGNSQASSKQAYIRQARSASPTAGKQETATIQDGGAVPQHMRSVFQKRRASTGTSISTVPKPLPPEINTTQDNNTHTSPLSSNAGSGSAAVSQASDPTQFIDQFGSAIARALELAAKAGDQEAQAALDEMKQKELDKKKVVEPSKISNTTAPTVASTTASTSKIAELKAKKQRAEFALRQEVDSLKEDNSNFTEINQTLQTENTWLQEKIKKLKAQRVASRPPATDAEKWFI